MHRHIISTDKLIFVPTLSAHKREETKEEKELNISRLTPDLANLTKFPSVTFISVIPVSIALPPLTKFTILFAYGILQLAQKSKLTEFRNESDGSESPSQSKSPLPGRRSGFRSSTMDLIKHSLND
ncbi:hypothetical protein C8J56DRAFT_885629 [Mycena floridula]|nr:hypothetical protein C8J56DRAFT_885629 [Mycena floridula]